MKHYNLSKNIYLVILILLVVSYVYFIFFQRITLKHIHTYFMLMSIFVDIND